MKRNNNHIFDLAKALWGYRLRKTVCAYPPTRLWLEASSICNLSCGLCPNKTLPPEDKGNMNFSLFKQIVDEGCNFLHDIYLFHRGESSTHPRLFDMIRYIKNKGIRVVLHTNATLLSKEKSNELLTTGLDFISFSFDGYDKETYEKARIGADFDVTLKNIIDFLELKKKLNQRQPYTVLQVMELDNTDAIGLKLKKQLFLQNLKNLPLNKLIIRKPHNWAGSIYLSSPNKPIVHNNTYAPCPFLWYSQTILWDGTILPCCQDFMGELKMGKIGSLNLLKAWNSPDMIALRKTIINEKSTKKGHCGSCDKLYRKTFLGIPVDYLVPFLRINLLRILELNFTLFNKK